MTICPRKELTLRFHLAVLYIRLLQFVKDRAFQQRKQNPTSQFDFVCGVWWRMTGSNRRPPACKAGALPTELIPLFLGDAALLSRSCA